MADPGIQRLLLKAVLSLPRPLLRALAGGGVVYRGGRTLDPRLQFLASQAQRRPSIAASSPVEARALNALALLPLAGKPEPGVAIETLDVPGSSGLIKARAYRPQHQDADAPLMVYAHSGGGVIGDLDSCEVFCTLLAKIVRCPVLSVDYALAPEHRFPAGLEDMLAAYRWARDNSDRFGAPLGRVAVGGDSIGGNFAAVIAQEMKRNGEAQPALQLLIYPAVDMGDERASMTIYAESFPLTQAVMAWFWGHYIGPEDSPGDLRLSPGREGDLSGLAPTVLVTAGFDPLVDQGEAYARRLREAGNRLTYRCFDHLTHAFTAYTGVIPGADSACREIATLVRAQLDASV